MDEIKYVGFFKILTITDYNTNYYICNIDDVVSINKEQEEQLKKEKKTKEEISVVLDLDKVKEMGINIDNDETDSYKIASKIYSSLANKFYKFFNKGNENYTMQEIRDDFTLALCSYAFNVDNELQMNNQEEALDLYNQRKDYERLFNRDKTKLVPFKKALEDIKGYVLCQDDQVKKVLYSIYNNIKISDLNLDYEEIRKKKQNVLIAGPTGTGKTEIAIQLARMFSLPIVIEDMTRFTEAGYVGADIESVYTHLINEAQGDIDLAQKGILVLDEIDKLASTAKDNVSRDGVQNALLKILDGGKQMYTQKNGMASKEMVFDTSNLTIIGLGAFEGIDKIRDKRIKKSNSTSIGFSYTDEEETYVDKEINSDDYIEYGINSQIVGRFHTKASLNPLGVNELVTIMKNSKTSITNINIKALKLQNIDLVMSDDYYEEVAKLAVKLNNGVRSINTVVDYSLEDAMINIFDDDSYTELLVTGKTVKDNKIYTLKKGN